MMSDSRGPRGGAWADVTEVLHGLSTVMSVRVHYAEGHPAIARADAAAAAGFERLLERVPEIVVALIDDEFVVSERPMPELRARLSSLAEAMTRHGIECLVFQRGITIAECALLGRGLGATFAAEDPAHHREQMQAGLAHVLLRFAEVKSSQFRDRRAGQAPYLVPEVSAALDGATRALQSGGLVDRTEVRGAAARIVAACRARSFAVEARAWARGELEDATHATNVALMTAAMALYAGYDDTTCVEAAASAMLHDIGQRLLAPELRIPEALVRETDKNAFREHAVLGAIALLGAGCPALWVAAALEHHRGVDGGGYPLLGDRGSPHELVRMIALASYIDRRRTIVDGHGDDPVEALERAFASQERDFGADVVRLFARALGVYPPGTVVELSDRTVAMVVNAGATDPLRPQVRLLLGEDAGRRLDLKDLNAVEDRHVVSITRGIAPPMLVRGGSAVRATTEAGSAPPPPDSPLAPASSPPTAHAHPTASRKTSAPAAPTSARPPLVLDPPPATFISQAPSRRSSPPRSSRPVIPREEPDAPLPALRSPRISVKLQPTSPPPATTPPPIARDGSDLPPLAKTVLGRLDDLLVLSVPPSALTNIGLDHRAGFILTFVDGRSSIDTILDASGLPHDVGARLLADLLERGVLAFRPKR